MCEIIKHPAFEKYIAEIEIYVNGIVTSQIHTLNSLEDFARQQVMENHHPDENDFTQRELNACYADEYEFSGMSYSPTSKSSKTCGNPMQMNRKRTADMVS